MCTIYVPCPLCSHLSFKSVASLRVSLIKAVNSPLSCPICAEIVMGIDKLTLHLIMHTNNLTTTNDEMEISVTNLCTKPENNTTLQFHNMNSSKNIGTMTEIQSTESFALIPPYNQHNINKQFSIESTSSEFSNEKNKLNPEQLKQNSSGETLLENSENLQQNVLIHQTTPNPLNVISLTVNDTIPPSASGHQINMINDNNNNININENIMYPCNLCTKSYKMKARLRLHLKVKHFVGSTTTNGTTAADKNTSKLNICEKIRMINSKQRANLAKNCNLESRITKSPNNNFIDNNNSSTVVNNIELNNDLLRNSSPLLLHENKEYELIETGALRLESLKTWKCDVCSKFYTTKYFLKKHKRIHTGETPYTCDICKKSFTFQQSYHKHLLYHSDDKPHICKTCGRAFKELSTLHNHERIHSGEKPFECETCGKRFRQRVSNYVHQRTHTGVKPYTCQICLKNFRYKVTLRTHKCSGGFPDDITQPSPPPPIDKVTTQAIEENLKKLLQFSAILPQSQSQQDSITSHNNYIQSNDSALPLKVDFDERKNHCITNRKVIVEPINLSSPGTMTSSTEKNEIGIETASSILEMNEEMLSKSIDEIVAESCQKLGIHNAPSSNCDLNEILNLTETSRNISSPTEQLQNLCLYSPMSIENPNASASFNFNEDFFKQLFGETKKNL